MEPDTRAQVTIMVIATVMEFACGFGALSLLIFGWFEIIEERISAGQIIALPLSFCLILLTGYLAMNAIVRPTRRRMVYAALSGIAAMLAIIALEF
jgi:hypothetical protein